MHIPFKKATWENVYTSSQRGKMIYGMMEILESISENSETKKLIKDITIEEIADADMDVKRKGYKLALGSQGFLEARLTAKLTESDDPEEKFAEIEIYTPVPKEAYVRIIEKYKLDYKKLEAVKELITNKIVGH